MTIDCSLRPLLFTSTVMSVSRDIFQLLWALTGMRVRDRCAPVSSGSIMVISRVAFQSKLSGLISEMTVHTKPDTRMEHRLPAMVAQLVCHHAAQLAIKRCST